MSSSAPIFDRATGRVVAVLVLLIVIAAALRGYLPGVERTERQPPHSGASLVYVAVLLSVSLAIVGVAVIVRLRDPRRTASSAGPLPTRFSEGVGRPGWRVMLIGTAVLLVWLLLLWLLSKYAGPQQIDQSQSVPRSTVPPPPGSPAQRPGRRDTGPDRDVLRYLIVSTVALLVMIVGGAIALQWRRVSGPRSTASQPASDTAAVVAAATSLARAAESGLAEIEDLDHEPRQAIIACYAAMERELRYFPGAAPQDFDTPTEVLARAVDRNVLHGGTAADLVGLFEEARFSPHVMTEMHRGRAVDVLQLVLNDIRSST